MKPCFQFICPEPCPLLRERLRSQFQKNPPSYRNLQSPRPPHFSSSWHLLLALLQVHDTHFWQALLSHNFYLFTRRFMSFCIHVDTTVSPTFNFIALLPMCFCCSDTGWCKLLCQQLYCWSMAHCSRLLSNAGRSSKTSIVTEGSLSPLVLGFLCSPQSVSLASTHQFTPVSSSYIHQWLLDRKQQHQAWSPSDSCPAPQKVLNTLYSIDFRCWCEFKKP